MKKHTEKQPIDDLFARKLSNISLPPNSDGFERLQTRMGQSKSEARVAFWHNPTRQRYMAAAACLLLVCLFGWLYQPSSGTKTTTEGPQVAIKKTSPVHSQKSVEEQPNQLAEQPLPDTVIPVLSNQETDNERLAKVENASESDKVDNHSTSQPAKVSTVILQPDVPVRSEPSIAQTKPAETKVDPEAVNPKDVTPVIQETPEQVADNKAADKPTPTAERVLIVTIAEPESVVAARQAARASAEEKSVAANDKSEKETKAGTLWQQVKRIKQGELFAHRDNPGNDDRGLLGRAYNGLKHSLDKDKSTKQ